MTTDTLLQLDRVNLVYRALPALQDIDWTLAAGQQWACLGPNGAGKTSLARVVSGQASHHSGTVRRGAAIAEGGVAYVCFEQARALCERDSKLDDSEFRADASDPGTRVRDLILGGRDADETFHHWVARLCIGHILERGLRYISTGEMRKTLLLSAILSEPGLLILDSPLDGLDRDSQAQMRQVLDELLASGLPVLLLCRGLEDIPAGISHVLVLDAGQVLRAGPRGEVLADDAVKGLMNPPLPALADLPPPAPRPYTLPGEGPLLALRNVGVRYGELTVMEGVDWTFDRDRHCCASGPNGCGKSTLLSLITGDNHKAYGQDITLFGIRRGSGESVWDIKQKFGLLDNRLHLDFKQRMGVMEVVVSGFFDSVGLYDDWGDTQRHGALDWLRALGMGDYAGARFDALSFGLQRMVLLARAMVKSPAVLILDEPTLGLDTHHRALMLRAIDHIAAHSDTRVIFVSHSAGEVPRCINQYLTFEPGENGYTVRCVNT
ncbi:ATP-binding cassette domain-containing protein [Parahaliea mediterranea]|uniref:ATP-binding cassette domain-containing protein n=1 Tax=Parahaliea mediterranea TaxID=651086 RepID=A0A939IM70_9GAMM|nr:ATP-binding cassette domain-containing protein [Parahaliea mediterranea]MBN7799111.1 ATP-binding cassette domain-containing protein [Parahaliea mediterranea]